MLQSKLVSVIMPVYNGQKYLLEAINSILTQTYFNFEFIIINDGSTDDTSRILSSVKDPRIMVVNFEKNKGIVEALNHGIRLASGEFIARMDADDIALPIRLSRQVEAFIKHPQWLVCDSDYYLLDGAKKSESKSNWHGDALKLTLIFSTCFCHPSVMMRNIFSKTNIAYNKEFKHVEDYKLWTDLAGLGQFGHIEEPLLLYRMHPKQVSNIYQDTQLQQSKIIRRTYLSNLGLKMSEETLSGIDCVGNNVFIKHQDQLIKIEKSLMEVSYQLIDSKQFDEKAVKLVFHKFWWDSCGYTNLGFKAFLMYRNSSIAQWGNGNQKLIKLLLKCLMRSIR